MHFLPTHWACPRYQFPRITQVRYNIIFKHAHRSRDSGLPYFHDTCPDVNGAPEEEEEEEEDDEGAEATGGTLGPFRLRHAATWVGLAGVTLCPANQRAPIDQPTGIYSRLSLSHLQSRVP